MRAGYGKNLRVFLAKNSNPLKLIDYGGNKIFETATVDVNTLIASKEKNFGKTLAATIADGCTKNLSDYLQHHYTINSFINSDNWVLLNPIEMSIKEKIESNGNPLSNWDIAINYGIKTGYNDAFIINENIRDMLIASDPNSAELIRPILRGKDIKRYSYEFANLWLIFIPCGFTNSKSKNQSQEEWFKNTYPAIYRHLIDTEMELSKNRNSKSKGLYKRDDQGDYWWELRSCKYSEDFSSQKLMYSEIVQEPHFYLDAGHFFPEATSFIISGSNLECLLFLLNSNITFALFKLFYAGGGLGDHGIRYKKAFLNDLRLPAINDENIVYFKDMYNNLNQSNMIVNKDIQKELDLYIGRLYGLSEEEINYLIQDL